MVGLEQPYAYRRRELIEPDWRRLPGWARVTPGEWESAQWQRAHCVKNARQLRDVTGGSLGEEFFDAVLGISYWTKNYRTALEAADPVVLHREYPYYDPIHLLPAEGQAWWRSHASATAPELVR